MGHELQSSYCLLQVCTKLLNTLFPTTHPPSLLPPPNSGHKSAVTCIQFDHNGTQLVSGSKVSVSLTLVSHDALHDYCYLGH